MIGVLVLTVVLAGAAWSLPAPIPVQRVGPELSWAEFHRRFARPGVPVVLAGGAASWPAANWTRQRLSELCGGRQFGPREARPGSAAWGGMHEQGESMTLDQLFDRLESCPEGRLPTYLHDEQLCNFCPALAPDVTVLSFWSQNLLFKAVRSGAPCRLSEYVGAWPALFVGGNGTETRLHQDHLATAFWMAVLQGRKRFALADPSQADALGAEQCSGATQVCRRVTADLLTPNQSSHPRLAEVRWWAADLAAGDLIWVPPGWFHQARNYDRLTVAVSANYADYTNYKIVLEQARLQGHSLVENALSSLAPVLPEDPPRDKTVEEYLGTSCPVPTDCADRCGDTPRSAVLTAFRGEDKDRNAVLSPAELARLFGIAGETKTEVFKTVDADSSGFVTFVELCEWENRGRPRAKRKLDLLEGS